MPCRAGSWWQPEAEVVWPTQKTQHFPFHVAFWRRFLISPSFLCMHSLPPSSLSSVILQLYTTTWLFRHNELLYSYRLAYRHSLYKPNFWWLNFNRRPSTISTHACSPTNQRDLNDDTISSIRKLNDKYNWYCLFHATVAASFICAMHQR